MVFLSKKRGRIFSIKKVIKKHKDIISLFPICMGINRVKTAMSGFLLPVPHMYGDKPCSL
ncbi:protein of unknown function [Xenorhabdus poinarii G6]|uniref:Uncharacterized protein n=1 Tax=Xenorhabdus poinarii G6 TaxID=1354304 RepID=A0A068R014_9GAMM|nr:protein of unknown function [Xenorhabdus poinarii G6]